jgi:hypothetical protein
MKGWRGGENKYTGVFTPEHASYATVRQLEVMEAFEKSGQNIDATAKALGVTRKAVTQSLDAVILKAQIRGYSPEHQMTRPVPEMHVAKGVSTLFDADGKVRAQWVKSELDRQKYLQAIRDVVADAMNGLPRAEVTPMPVFTHACLCNLYTLTDCHVGALAWDKETGTDWDLEIAERTLTGCFEHMVNSSPQAKVAIVNQLGDFLHSDGIQGVTPTSGHLLDMDSRFSKVVRVAVRILRRIVDFALARHEKVIVIMAEGNHDISSSIWLRELFRLLYEDEPRVEVIDTPLPYYVYQHGRTMLCFHHGHLKKNGELPILFAAQFPKIWGETAKRYAHCGHRHHVEEKEHSGITVVQHPTLAARDAYAARGGWIADRQVTSITYHSAYGQVARNTITPEMIGEPA